VWVVDDYFAGLDATTRAAFERIRVLVMEIAPEAEQGSSYGMAALMYKGKPLLGFRSAKQHLSIFPFSPAAVDTARAELRDLDLSKGTIRFTAATPVPEQAVRDVVQHRMLEIEQGLAARKRQAGAGGGSSR
jgi:uncharacterized protein YdhG (YjbR/CyaY superfamily)